jgi:hypothetical protein
VKACGTACWGLASIFTDAYLSTWKNVQVDKWSSGNMRRLRAPRGLAPPLSQLCTASPGGGLGFHSSLRLPSLAPAPRMW